MKTTFSAATSSKPNSSTHYWGYRELTADEIKRVGGGDDGGGGSGDAGDYSDGAAGYDAAGSTSGASVGESGDSSDSAITEETFGINSSASDAAAGGDNWWLDFQVDFSLSPNNSSLY